MIQYYPLFAIGLVAFYDYFLSKKVLKFIIPVMIVGFALILFSGTAINYLISTYVFESEYVAIGIRILKWVAVLVLFIISISTLYNVALINRRKWKILSAGATWATLFIILASMGMSYYIDNFII